MPDTDLDELDEQAHADAKARAEFRARSRRRPELLIPILALALGSAGTFVVETVTSGTRQTVTLENQQKLLDELRQHTITRDTFDATILPMQSDIAEIKKAVETLHKARYDDDKVTYRTVRVIRASN